MWSRWRFSRGRKIDQCGGHDTGGGWRSGDRSRWGLLKMFADRRQAGTELAAKLGEKNLPHPVVLAVPRGGVVVAEPIASALRARMELVIPRKVGAPGFPEVAMAAVAPDGTVIYNEDAMAQLGLTVKNLEPLVAAELEEIDRRTKAYRQGPGFPDIFSQTAILVDDGIATGLTIRAALTALRKQKPLKLVLAVPVAPRETVQELQDMVDDLVCLLIPDDFAAVGQFYLDFRQVEDREVRRILRHNHASAGHTTD
jgi:putative phosphoribosyl transferase